MTGKIGIEKLFGIQRTEVEYMKGFLDKEIEETTTWLEVSERLGFTAPNGQGADLCMAFMLGRKVQQVQQEKTARSILEGLEGDLAYAMAALNNRPEDEEND